MKPVKSKILLFAFFLLVLVVSCAGDKIDEDTAVKIYVERIIVEEKYSFNLDSIKVQKEKIFSKYEVTPGEYEAYLKGLSDESELWADFFRRTDAYLSELKKSEAIQ
ncbi:MAG: hypothetical protein AB1521_01075 [Bacteroidota bacterium]